MSRKYCSACLVSATSQSLC